MIDCVGDHTKCGIDKRLCMRGIVVCKEMEQQIVENNKMRQDGWKQLEQLKENR